MKPELHVVLGLTPEEYDAELERGQATASKDPRWHSHPLLGITGHSHSSVGDARRQHGHLPSISWDFTPIFIEEG